MGKVYNLLPACRVMHVQSDVTALKRMLACTFGKLLILLRFRLCEPCRRIQHYFHTRKMLCEQVMPCNKCSALCLVFVHQLYSRLDRLSGLDVQVEHETFIV